MEQRLLICLSSAHKRKSSCVDINREEHSFKYFNGNEQAHVLGQRSTVPFVDVVGPEYVDSIYVREVEDGVVAGRIWQLHQNLIQQHRLQGSK